MDGLRNGHGIWIYKNKRYEGNWKNNMMEGEGIMEWDYQNAQTHRNSFKPNALESLQAGGSAALDAKK